MSDINYDPRYEESARADYLSALIDQERLEHAMEINELEARVEAIQALVSEQAKDEALWATPIKQVGEHWITNETVQEHVLKEALRKLHAVIERESGMSDINEVIFDLTSLRDGPWDLTQVDRSALTEAIALLERSAGVWVPVTDSTPANDVFEICYRPRADIKVLRQCRIHGRWQEEDGSPTIPASHWFDARLPDSGEEG